MKESRRGGGEVLEEVKTKARRKVRMMRTWMRPTYRGESSRTLYTRAQSHFTNYLRGKESFMYDHAVHNS